MADLRQRRSDLKRQVRDAAKKERNLAELAVTQGALHDGMVYQARKVQVQVAVTDLFSVPNLCDRVIANSMTATVVTTSAALSKKKKGGTWEDRVKVDDN